MTATPLVSSRIICSASRAIRRAASVGRDAAGVDVGDQVAVGVVVPGRGADRPCRPTGSRPSPGPGRSPISSTTTAGSSSSPMSLSTPTRQWRMKNGRPNRQPRASASRASSGSSAGHLRRDGRRPRGRRRSRPGGRRPPGSGAPIAARAARRATGPGRAAAGTPPSSRPASRPRTGPTRPRTPRPGRASRSSSASTASRAAAWSRAELQVASTSGTPPGAAGRGSAPAASGLAPGSSHGMAVDRDSIAAAAHVAGDRSMMLSDSSPTGFSRRIRRAIADVRRAREPARDAAEPGDRQHHRERRRRPRPIARWAAACR